MSLIELNRNRQGGGRSITEYKAVPRSAMSPRLKWLLPDLLWAGPSADRIPAVTMFSAPVQTGPAPNRAPIQSVPGHTQG
jgi:hypothetical protein